MYSPMTPEEQRLISDRVGKDVFERRIFMEVNRELKLGGKLRWCPVRILRPFAILFFKITFLWKRGYREFLNIQIRENKVEIPKLPKAFDGLKILHLSDLHFDLDTALTQAVIGKIKDIDYDIAVITGDFNNLTIHSDTKAFEEVQKLMPFFKAPVYAVLGNHDSYKDVHILEKMGVRILLNEHVAITKDGESIYLAGIDDPNIFKTHDIAKALDGVPANSVKLLLAHSPCIHKDAADAKVDFVMAGHIHGGQICLPLGVMIHPRNDRGSRSVWRGAWREGDTQGWTSAGTGSSGVPIRINCPPEIAIHVLSR